MVRIKPFKAYPSRSGNSFVFTIPKFLILSDIVDPEKRYRVELREVRDDKSSKGNRG